MEEIIKKHAKILDDKKAQTTNKIKYVSKYVENWLYVMANAKFSEGINFIDCMCNAGIYLDGDFCTSIEVLKLFVASAAILEKTMLKKSHLKTNLFEPLIKEGKLVKLNENVRKNNYTADFYDIKG